MNRRDESPPGEGQSVAVHMTHTGGRELLESGVGMTFKCPLVTLHQPPPKGTTDLTEVQLGNKY